MNLTAADHIFYMIENIPQSAAILFFFYNIGKPKKPYLFILLVTTLFFDTAYLFGELVFHWPLENGYFNIIRNIPLVFSLFYFFENSFKEKCLMYAALLIVMAVGNVILYPIFMVVSNTTLEQAHYPCPDQAIGTLTYTDYQVIMTLFIVEWWNRRKKNKWNNLPFCIGISVLLVIHFLFICYCMTKETLPVNYHMVLMQWSFQMIIFILVLAQFYTWKRNFELTQKNEEYKLMKLKNQFTYDYYQLANKRYNDISRIRHDLHNQISVVNVLLMQQNYAEAKKTAQQLQEKLDTIGQVAFCGNPMINSVLTLKVEEANRQGIETDILLHDCEDLPYENYDLCSLFSNLFDNALEECKKCHRKKICITIRTALKNDFFVIKFTNPTDREDDDFTKALPTSEKKEEGHGLGLSIIADIAKKYHGSHRFSVKNHVVSSVVYLRRMESETDKSS